MKRTITSPSDLKLKRKLQLVRTTIRELTPDQLEQVNGGSSITEPDSGTVTLKCCSNIYTYTG